ncbi:MAG: hypothetical protein RL032_2208 [Pseudomonadota bacterium]|jgi:hypothetical protein
MPAVHCPAFAVAAAADAGRADLGLKVLGFRVLLADFKANLIALDPVRSAIRAMALNDR